MHQYNKIMLYFWLFAGIFIAIGVTYMGITEGFDKWITSYTFAALAILMFFMRRYMVRRMEKHVAYLAAQKEKEASEEK
jgi:multidrug transporter EmrE-like cation transporter